MVILSLIILELETTEVRPPGNQRAMKDLAGLVEKEVEGDEKEENEEKGEEEERPFSKGTRVADRRAEKS